MRRLTALALTALIVLFSIPALADDGITAPAAGTEVEIEETYTDSNARAVVNGLDVIYTGAVPAVVDGVAMFPVGPVAEAMGLKFSWYPGRGTAVVSDGKLSVDFAVGQRIIGFDGSTFIADRDIMKNGDAVYVSAATMLRLAKNFGFEAQLDGRTLTIDAVSAFSIMVNGETLRFSGEVPVLRDGIYFIPVSGFASGFGLEYTWTQEERTAIMIQSDFGRYAAVEMNSDLVSVGGSAVENTANILYEEGKLYLDADTILSLAEYFGGVTSYNRYGNGIIISYGLPMNVIVNGRVVVFPDVLPTGEYLPARFPLEAMGLEFIWSPGEVQATISRHGDSVYLLVNDDSVIEGDRLMITTEDLAAIAEHFGMEVSIGSNVMEITDPRTGNVLLPNVTVKPDSVRVELDGRDISFPDVAPMIINGRTLIPVRAVVEEMNMDVEWDSESRTVIISKGGDSLSMTIGSAELNGIKGGQTLRSALDVPAELIDARTCIPIRAVMEFFGAKVDWDAENRVVMITSPVEVREVVMVPAGNSSGFEEILGFVIEAPVGAVDVEYYIADGNTAVVKFTEDNTVYYFSASGWTGNTVMAENELSGSRVSRRITVNGVQTAAIAGDMRSGGSGVRWTIGSYEFSLSTDMTISIATLLNQAEIVSKSFVLIREIEPEPEEYLDFSPEMIAEKVGAPSAFARLGIVMAPPEIGTQVEYRIWDGLIAEMIFYVNGHEYVLRAGENGGDLFGIDEEFVSGADRYVVGDMDEVTDAVVSRTESGAYVGTWKWGRVRFTLYSEDEFVTSSEFSQICSQCGSLSCRTGK